MPVMRVGTVYFLDIYLAICREACISFFCDCLWRTRNIIFCLKWHTVSFPSYKINHIFGCLRSLYILGNMFHSYIYKCSILTSAVSLQVQYLYKRGEAFPIAVSEGGFSGKWDKSRRPSSVLMFDATQLKLKSL